VSKYPAIWGVHMGAHVGNRPLEEGYVAIGWLELGDLRDIPAERDAFKVALLKYRPEAKEGAIPVHAGILFRFAHEMQAGDIVVYPSKHDRMVNIGRFTGGNSFVRESADEYPNRRDVNWLGSYPRTDFSQSALNEIGSAVTLFRIKRHADEFLAKIGLIGQPNLVTQTAEGAHSDASGRLFRQHPVSHSGVSGHLRIVAA
jgi:restriction system protein